MNDIAAIKAYLANNLPANGPEPQLPKGKKRKRKNAKLAFDEINTRINEQTYGNRPNVSNICLVLVNEKKIIKDLAKSGIKKFCDHIIVVSGENEIDLAAIRKKICPEAELVRGMYD